MEIRRYDEKIAVVTGAANGIGLSMVKRLVEEGAKVAALDIDTETMEKEYAGQEEDIYQVYCDVAEKESVDQAIAKVLEHFGRIDVLFSNAGIIGRQSLLDTTEETWRRVIDINLNGMFFVNQAVLRSMVERGIKGAVVNTSSIASATVSTNTGAYSASKGGVTQFTKWAALEMAPHGIRVNAIGPGTSVTRITEGTRFNPERNEKFLRNIPMGRMGSQRRQRRQPCTWAARMPATLPASHCWKTADSHCSKSRGPGCAWIPIPAPAITQERLGYEYGLERKICR